MNMFTTNTTSKIFFISDDIFFDIASVSCVQVLYESLVIFVAGNRVVLDFKTREEAMNFYKEIVKELKTT